MDLECTLCKSTTNVDRQTEIDNDLEISSHCSWCRQQRLNTKRMNTLWALYGRSFQGDRHSSVDIQSFIAQTLPDYWPQILDLEL